MGVEILLAFFAAAGVVLLLWCLLGLLLLPVFGRDMVTLCFSEGDGTEMEQRVRAYGWLRDGKMTGGRLIIVDRGLSERGKKLAECLCDRYNWVEFYTGKVPEAFLAEKAGTASNTI